MGLNSFPSVSLTTPKWLESRLRDWNPLYDWVGEFSVADNLSKQDSSQNVINFLNIRDGTYTSLL